MKWRKKKKNEVEGQGEEEQGESREGGTINFQLD